MTSCEDIVRIHASRETVMDWLSRMPDHYKEWHPKDHLTFETKEHEHKLHEGSKVRTAERLGDFTLTFTFRITRVEPGREISWRALFPYRLINLHGRFLFEEDQGVTSVTAVSSYGWRMPIIGRVLDWLIERFFLPKAIVLRHMHEEGEYMRASIEKQE